MHRGACADVDECVRRAWSNSLRRMLCSLTSASPPVGVCHVSWALTDSGGHRRPFTVALGLVSRGYVASVSSRGLTSLWSRGASPTPTASTCCVSSETRRIPFYSNLIRVRPKHALDRNVFLNHQLFKHVKGGARRSQIQRIVFDWHYTGRNRFKATGISGDLRYPLCFAKVENQCHIIWQCTHSDMALLRNEHLGELSTAATKRLPHVTTSNLAKASQTLHELLLDHRNYSLLVGRVHPHQQKLLQHLPRLSASDMKQLLDVWRTYAAMAVDLHTQRQQSITFFIF